MYTRWRHAHGLGFILKRRLGRRLGKPPRRFVSSQRAPAVVAKLCTRYPRTAYPPHRTTYVVHSRFRSRRCRRFLRLLDLWGGSTSVSTVAKKMLMSSEGSTHPPRGCCSTSNQSEETPSSGRTQALIPSQNCRVTAIIWCGTPMRVSCLLQKDAVERVVRLLEVNQSSTPRRCFQHAMTINMTPSYQ